MKQVISKMIKYIITFIMVFPFFHLEGGLFMGWAVFMFALLLHDLANQSGFLWIRNDE